MNKLNIYLSILLVVMIAVGCTVKETVFKTDPTLLKSIDRSFTDADRQYQLMMKNLPPNQFPKTFYPLTGKFEACNSDWWVSGFYPGSLLYIYEQTKDTILYKETERMLKVLEKEKNNKTTHDLGFMMYCSFGMANSMNPKPEYKDILISSARSLASRFNPKVGCIQSWDAKPDEFLVIIDNMMNLELLFWATRETGDSTYYKMAVTHANTTMKNHFRPDYSSYHVINYHPETGQVQEKRTDQGYADESAWARGQAWGLYGYTLMYRETKDKRYLDQANHIAGFLLQHPNMPEDKIPFWDFNAPDIPKALRDASAGAVMAAALLELCRYNTSDQAQLYFKTAEKMIRTLSSVQYKAALGTNGGFILKHGVGHMPKGSEVDVPLTYGDYYYLEALKRYKDYAN
uniref:glycoside hydrolase family 88 protein n=1 Tax=Pedobacter schmidteae TaxID=2201271 RepID=UPI000EAEB9AE|nr:glycoside hydrolase family 88 protein [Pedobacter schmidteae]